MKVVLLNPNNTLNKNDRMIQDFVGTVTPYGLVMLASVLKNSGHEVYLADQYVEYKNAQELLDFLTAIRPDVLGVSVLTPAFGWVRELCPRLKKLIPKMKIVLGNSFASIFYEKIMEQGLADAVIRGEGEYTFNEYLSALEKGSDLREVRGLSFKAGNNITHNLSRGVIEDLDQLPYPDWSLIDFKKYNRIPILSLYGPALMIQGSRGCNYNCFYCSQDADFKKFRRRKIARIADEIEYQHKQHNVSNFIFLDAYFPFSVGSGMKFCDELIKRGLHKKVRWLTETKVDLVNYELLKKMKEAGAYLVMYGFETGSERILKMINKRTTLDKAYQVMKDTRKAGLNSLGLFMLGFPGETEGEFNKTIRFSKKLNCDIVKFNLLTPYPGSGLYNDYVRDKMIAYRRPELFTSWYMISNQADDSFNFSNMETSRLLNIQRKALLSYYVRPSIILNALVKRIVRFRVIFKAFIFLVINLFFVVKKAVSEMPKHKVKKA